MARDTHVVKEEHWEGIQVHRHGNRVTLVMERRAALEVGQSLVETGWKELGYAILEVSA